MKEEITSALEKISAKTKTSALVIPDKVTLEQWVAIGRKLYHAGQTMTWWLADWAAYGEREYGKLREFCDANGMNYGTLRQYAYVAAAVELSSRLDNLSFSHHAEVAALPKRDQKKWLNQAAKDNWPVVELRRRIRESTMIHAPEKTFGPSDEGIEISNIFRDASVFLEKKSNFVKENSDEVWNYASPFLKKAAALWPEKVVVK